MKRQLRKRYVGVLNLLGGQVQGAFWKNSIEDAKTLLSESKTVDEGKFIWSHRVMGRSQFCDVSPCALALIDKVAWMLNDYLSDRRLDYLVPMMYLVKLEKIANKGVANCSVAGSVREDFWIEL